MKYIVYTFLFVGLLVACGENKKSTEKQVKEVQTVNANGLTIAYYEQDSIVTGFDYYRKIDSTLKVKETAFKAKLEKMYASYERYAMNAQKKAETGEISGFQLQDMQETIQRKQQEIAMTEQQEGGALQQETMEYTNSLAIKISEAGKEFAEANNIDMLYGYQKGGQITYISNAFDMTEEFISFLNKRDKEIIEGTDEEDDK
ncbi:MAG: OmpH family outer membrane protein [Lishizhenia sp.]